MMFIPSHFDDPIMVSFTGDNFPLSYHIIHNLIRAGDRQEAVYKDLVGTFGVLFNKGLFISVLYCCVFCLSPLPLCSLGSYCLSRRSEERVNSHFFSFPFFVSMDVRRGGLLLLSFTVLLIGLRYSRFGRRGSLCFCLMHHTIHHVSFLDILIAAPH